MSFSPEDGIVLRRKACRRCFAGDFYKILVIELIDLQHQRLHMSSSKDLGMLHLCCAIANACAKAASDSQTVFMSCNMLSYCAYGADRGMFHCDKPILRKLLQAVPYAHDNHKLHIKCFLCGAFIKNRLDFFVRMYFLLVYMNKQWCGNQ